ncbi:MAG TPA: thioredoxin family protein [Candidatus Saccharicenans sp.]|nr:thioredoxin family protein [Candidatus Saccharicenans sp.]HQM73648.1 thioredoxin family protein [Candidatus Saccharicenans sp.]
MKALYFKNKSCSVCSAFFPRLVEICEEYQIPYEVIDTLEEPEKAGQELVLSVPTIIFLDEENRELRRFSGYFGSQEIKDFLERYFFRIGWARNINNK